MNFERFVDADMLPYAVPVSALGIVGIVVLACGKAANSHTTCVWGDWIAGIAIALSCVCAVVTVLSLIGLRQQIRRNR